METIVKERSTMSERISESTICDSTTMKMKEGEGFSSRDIRIEKHEKKI